MVSRVALLGTLGGIVAFAIVAGASFAQSPSASLRANEERIAEEIRAAQSEGGPRSADLIGPLTELSGLYETQGEHALAAAALAEARHVVRATYGLYTLDQVPLLDQALENQHALGNVAMAQAIEEELYILAERHPDDLRTVAIHRGLAERRMDLRGRFLAKEYPPEIYPEFGFFEVTPDAMMQGLISEAQVHYADAVAVLLRNGLHSSGELRDLEMEIVRTSDSFRATSRPDQRSMFLGTKRGQGGLPAVSVPVGERCMPGRCELVSEQLRKRTNTLWDLAGTEASQDAAKRRHRVDHMTTHYALARESHRRLVAYAEEVSARAPDDSRAWENRLQAYLELADWDLLYSFNGAALDEYAQVHEMLKTADGAAPLIAEVFAPPMPIVLPTFQPNPLQTPASDRYIDVAFEITKYGEGRRIEIRGAAPGVSDAAKTTLVNVIKDSRFRPRAVDGDVGRASPIVVRYYLNE